MGKNGFKGGSMFQDKSLRMWQNNNTVGTRQGERLLEMQHGSVETIGLPVLQFYRKCITPVDVLEVQASYLNMDRIYRKRLPPCPRDALFDAHFELNGEHWTQIRGHVVDFRTGMFRNNAQVTQVELSLPVALALSTELAGRYIDKETMTSPDFALAKDGQMKLTDKSTMVPVDSHIWLNIDRLRSCNPWVGKPNIPIHIGSCLTVNVCLQKYMRKSGEWVWGVKHWFPVNSYSEYMYMKIQRIPNQLIRYGLLMVCDNSQRERNGVVIASSLDKIQSDMKIINKYSKKNVLKAMK